MSDNSKHIKQLNEQVNINQFPPLDKANLAGEGVHLTMGDLHGNGLKLLYMLVRHGVLENISQQDYEYFANEVYPKKVSEGLTFEHINTFQKILENAKVGKEARKVFIDLIGDEICDRGMNDYYVLMILNKLDNEKVKYSINASNHGIEPIILLEKNKLFKAQTSNLGTNKDESILHSQFAISMTGLQSLMDSKDFPHINKESIGALFEKCYKPHFKLLSYSLSSEKSEITFKSHAGVGLETIKEIAAAFAIPYKGDSAAEMAETIDSINNIFQSKYVKKNTVQDLFPRALMEVGYKIAAIIEDPFVRLLWNRDYTNLNRPETLSNGDKINFVHGHDSKDPLNKKNLFNIDNSLGKGLMYHEHKYNILVSKGQLEPKATLENVNLASKKNAQKTTTTTTTIDTNAEKQLLDNFIKSLTNLSTNHRNEGKGTWGTYDWRLGVDQEGRRFMQNLYFKIQQNQDGSVVILDKKNQYKPVDFSAINTHANKSSIVELMRAIQIEHGKKLEMEKKDKKNLINEVLLNLIDIMKGNYSDITITDDGYYFYFKELASQEKSKLINSYSNAVEKIQALIKENTEGKSEGVLIKSMKIAQEFDAISEKMVNIDREQMLVATLKRHAEFSIEKGVYSDFRAELKDEIEMLKEKMHKTLSEENAKSFYQYLIKGLENDGPSKNQLVTLLNYLSVKTLFCDTVGKLNNRIDSLKFVANMENKHELQTALDKLKSKIGEQSDPDEVLKKIPELFKIAYRLDTETKAKQLGFPDKHIQKMRTTIENLENDYPDIAKKSKEDKTLEVLSGLISSIKKIKGTIVETNVTADSNHSYKKNISKNEQEKFDSDLQACVNDLEKIVIDRTKSQEKTVLFDAMVIACKVDEIHQSMVPSDASLFINRMSDKVIGLINKNELNTIFLRELYARLEMLNKQMTDMFNQEGPADKLDFMKTSLKKIENYYTHDNIEQLKKGSVSKFFSRFEETIKLNQTLNVVYPAINNLKKEAEKVGAKDELNTSLEDLKDMIGKMTHSEEVLQELPKLFSIAYRLQSESKAKQGVNLEKTIEALEKEYPEIAKKAKIVENKPLLFSAPSVSKVSSIPSVDPAKQFLDLVKNKEGMIAKGAFKQLDAQYVKENFNFVGADPKFGFSVGVSTFNNSFYIQDPSMSVQLLPDGGVSYINRKNGNKPATPDEIAKSPLVQKMLIAMTQHQALEGKMNSMKKK